MHRRVALTELARLEQALDDGVHMFGMWRYTTTSDRLVRFERTFKWLLHTYQMSFWWSVQFALSEQKKRKIRFWYSPVYGEYRRGFTQHTEDDITQALYPDSVPHYEPTQRRDMSV